MPLRLEEDGAELRPGAAGAFLEEWRHALDTLPVDRAGVRVHGMAALHGALAPTGPIGTIVADRLGRASRPVRAIFFDKTAATNWALGWHQDRTICVRKRVDVDGFGPWTIKQGLLHVAPPFAVSERMMTVRIHLDDVDADNAPLLIAPGSHRIGRVPVAAIEDAVRWHGVRSCPAKAGDAWLYATPILHASAAADRPRRRRVLQVDYSAEELTGGLEWAEI